MKFSELGLDPKLLAAIEAAGYTTPTPIQEQAIPYALAARDVLGIAQTGTGKTASFTLPMIEILSKGRARARMPRSLILCPTRELAAQVSENFDIYGKNHNLTKALLIGGVSFNDQDKLIDRGVDVLIATPGRLLDHFERGKLMLTGIEIMVVDEADRMLDMGFIDDIERIFKLTPFTRQTLFFSATMPPEITRLTQEFLSNPARVEVARQASVVDTVEQRLCEIKISRRDRAAAEKRAVLRALMEAEGETLTNAIIFCNRKIDVGVLHKSLIIHGYDVAALHGDLDQRIRTQVLDGFRAGNIKILVASDVAARGLDIPRVSHVFNFDVPLHSEDYVHRIGRTGRAGRAGVAITIAAGADDKLVTKIEELIGTTIPRVASPVAERRDDDVSATEKPDREERPDVKRGGRRRRGESDPARDQARDQAREPAREPVLAQAADQAATATPSREPKRDVKPAAEPEVEPAAMAASRPAPRRRNSRESEPKRPEADAGGRSAKRGRGGRGEHGEGRSTPVLGMGDHVPAFMMREVPLPAWKKSSADETDAETDAETSEASLDAA